MTEQDFESALPERLRELSGSETEPAWDAMEQRLLRAFAVHHAPVTGRPVSEASGPRLSVMWRAAAAAVVVLATAITFYPRTEPRQMPPARPAGAPRDTTKPPVAPESREVPTTITAAPKSSASTGHRSKPGPRALNSSTSEGNARVISERSPFADFVALPGASALPDFESGRIMRVEIPLTGLPAFGLDMVLDAAPGTIEADVLVGQDGVPRAIRLAGAESQ